MRDHAGSTPMVLLNTGHSARGNRGTGTAIEVAGSNRVVGSAESGDCGGEFRYRVFFVAEFDRPFAAFGTWNGDALAPSAAPASGADTGAFVAFAPDAAPLRARIGLSS